MPREIIPEQAEAKEKIKDYLMKNRHVLLPDIANECGIGPQTLYSWINGRTLNLKTPAYWKAIQKWVKENCNG